MKQIWRYQLHSNYEQLTIPINAEVITAQTKDDQINVWLMVDDDEPQIELRTFVLYATGQSIEDLEDLKYIGTCQQGNRTEDSLIWHVFEKVK